ncbi:MAG: ribonucleoside-diphosphate reductase, adenosylcobalamin-dependent, partial [Anaerolineae bacterium]|nr:ribonucleoside-diphosphate reductase, adenosylcobalamin-dependent [Anaerolineae bacterium]
WKLGCKGLTVYVTGSREHVVLETRKTAEAKQGDKVDAPGLQAETPLAESLHSIVKPRPRVLHGVTYRQPTPLGTAFITVNANGDSQPFEVFLTVGKAGSDIASVAEAFGRLISLVLRLPSTLTPRARLEEVCDQLAGIGGGRPMGFGPNRVRSLPDGIAQALAEHLGAIPDAPKAVSAEQLALPFNTPKADLCPECGQATFVNEEGCRKCHSCGFSEC